jgi:hypothetical protein
VLQGVIGGHAFGVGGHPETTATTTTAAYVILLGYEW